MNRLGGSVCWALAATVSILGSNAFAQDDRDPNDMIRQYEGWWSFGGTTDACAIEGGDSNKVAIGRYEMSNGAPTFGTGTPKLGLWDSSCELYEPQFIEGKVESVAICTGEEGEQIIGRTKIFGSENQIEVRSPLGTFELQRCGANSRTSSQGVPRQELQQTAIAQVKPLADVQPPPPAMSDEQRKAVFAVYISHCDPTFSPLGMRSVEVGQALYDQYRNVFLIRYQMTCASFLRGEVYPALAALEIEQMLDLPDQTPVLDQRAADAVGYWLFLTRHSDVSMCDPALIDQQLSDAVGTRPEQLFSMATKSDLTALSIGYGQAFGTWYTIKSTPAGIYCENVIPILVAQVHAAIDQSANVLDRE